MSQTSVFTTLDVPGLQDKKARHIHAIQEMEKHLSVAHDGTIVLDVKNASDIQVDPDSFNELSMSLQVVNHLLRTGMVQPSEIRLKTEMPLQSPLAAEAIITAAGTCNGSDYLGKYWWGLRLYIDECITQDVVNGLKLGAAGAAVAAAALALGVPGVTTIPAGAPALVAALLLLGVAAITFVDGLGGNRGMEFAYTWIFNISWFWHQ